MSSRTKIVVLHMKEIIYTIIFAILAILLILLLVFMFFPKDQKEKESKGTYKDGIYTSSLTLNNTDLEVEVSVENSRIQSIRFSNLDETAAAMLPLAQPSMEDLAEQICRTQSLENLSFSSDSPYTSQVIVDAVADALEEAEP